jgi:hypothetical protein
MTRLRPARRSLWGGVLELLVRGEECVNCYLFLLFLSFFRGKKLGGDASHRVPVRGCGGITGSGLGKRDAKSRRWWKGSNNNDRL